MFEPIIGLEIHIQLNAKNKMFCGCSADIWQAGPNTHTCPTCLGLPGALPVPNKEAIEKTIKLGLAVGCEIAKESWFDRKNYFYPDLPKGYQISQFYRPFCLNGEFEIGEKENKRKIRIREIHLEEDTGKSFHEGKATLLDFNKSGIPLAELVTQPDFRTSEEVLEFCKKIHSLVRWLDVSEGDMEKGNLRLEANISMWDVGCGKLDVDVRLPDYKVEVKNINSFRFLGKVIDFEIRRQTEILKSGEKVLQETRGYDEKTGETFSQRTKEAAKDYRYFPEPDIPPILIEDGWVKEIKATLSALPWGRSRKYIDEYEIKVGEAELITSEKALTELFEEAISLASDKNVAKKMAAVLTNKKEARNLSAKELVDLVTKTVPSMLGEDAIRELCLSVINENTQAVSDYKKGKEASLQFLVGQVMRKSKGQAEAMRVVALLKQLLG